MLVLPLCPKVPVPLLGRWSVIELESEREGGREGGREGASGRDEGRARERERGATVQLKKIMNLQARAVDQRYCSCSQKAAAAIAASLPWSHRCNYKYLVLGLYARQAMGDQQSFVPQLTRFPKPNIVTVVARTISLLDH